MDAFLRTRIDTGMALLEGGNLADAEACFRQTLARFPEEPEAWHGLACVARAHGNASLAVGLAGRALRAPCADAQRARFHITLGAALMTLGHHKEALAALNVSVLLEPRDPRAYLAQAQALWRCGHHAKARGAMNEASMRAAEPAALLQQWGTFLTEAHALNEAVDVFREIARLLPSDGAALANFGAVLFETGRMEEARDALMRADILVPDRAPTLLNLGLVELALGRFPQAREALIRARNLAPEDRRILNNYGTLCSEETRFDEAESVFRALMDGNDSEAVRAHFNLGVIELGQGRMAEGWRDFESRLRLSPPHRSLPPWDGALTEERIAIHGEQGLGDIVQFLRYLPFAAQRAPLRVDLPAAARGLLALFPGIDGLMASGRIVTDGDASCQCSLLSLPFLLGAGAPDPASYLSCDVPRHPRRVGLFWSGNPQFRFDARRSIPRAALSSLLEVEGLDFVCLQHGADAASRLGMENPDLEGLDAMARAIASCALVIGVDSAPIHLAGALGTPAWLLNRFGGDWRWRGPAWYESVRVFACDTMLPPSEAWPAVVGRVADELRRWSGRGVF